MGSGSGGSYSGTNGGSQPYAPSYHVEQKMHQYDVNNGTYHDGKYDKNPTAKNLSDVINGNYIGSKSTSFQMPYVIDMDGNIIIGKRNGNGRGDNAVPTPHPTLIGGKDPVVKMAGILEVRGGKIYKYDNQSGHYKPNIKSMDAADEAFAKLDPKLFHKNFKKR
jgi:hypothetical protein